jgi:hypothetical protein
MFFVSKKKYQEALDREERWKTIVAGKTEQVEKLLEQIKDLYNGRANMYEYCCELKRDKDELFARVKELQARLDAYEEGKYAAREEEE